MFSRPVETMLAGRDAIRILIAEDDPGTRDLLIAAIEGFGYTATVAPDAETALASLGVSPPDCILSDIQMPGIVRPEAAVAVLVAETRQGWNDPVLLSHFEASLQGIEAMRSSEE
jgi:CheY-like chemotaxis protein